MAANPAGAGREQSGGGVFRSRLSLRAPFGRGFWVWLVAGRSRQTHVRFWRRNVLSVRDEKDRIIGAVSRSEEENGVVPRQG